MTIGYQIPQAATPTEAPDASGLKDSAAPAPDRSREAANMLELLSRQAPSVDLLRITSKAAQAVIRQF